MVPRQYYSAAFNIIQQPPISVSLQVGLLATMLSLSVSGLSLASTYSQIETLRRDSNALSKAIAGLAVTTGRSFPSQFEELISEGKYLIIYLCTYGCDSFWPQTFCSKKRRVHTVISFSWSMVYLATINIWLLIFVPIWNCLLIYAVI